MTYNIAKNILAVFFNDVKLKKKNRLNKPKLYIEPIWIVNIILKADVPSKIRIKRYTYRVIKKKLYINLYKSFRLDR